jgi:hypothetical protein
MTWEIAIPFRSEDDPVTAIDRSELSALGPGDAEIAGHIVRELAFTDGIETVRDALGHLEQLGDDGRRRLLDRARVAEGWPPTAAVDAAERQRSAPPVPVRTVAGAQTDSQGRLLQTCGQEGCPAYPVDESGALIGSDFVRWYCADHAAGHEAELVPRQAPRLLLQAGGGFRFEGELQEEAERGQLQDALMGEDFERRKREAEVEAELAAEAEARRAEVMATDAFANPLLGANWSGQA